MKDLIKRDLVFLIYGSGAIILSLVGFMIFSPFSSQFTEAGVRRGSLCEVEISELLNSGMNDQALELVDSLITTKKLSLPVLAYFDRYLPEDERMDVANARVDIYELQWTRIEILAKLNDTNELRGALKDYSTVIGYNQEEAKAMLEQLNGN